MGDHTGIGGCCSFFPLFWNISIIFFHILPSPDTWTSNFRHFLEVACFGSWGRLFEVVLVADQHDDRFRLESAGATLKNAEKKKQRNKDTVQICRYISSELAPGFIEMGVLISTLSEAYY